MSIPLHEIWYYADAKVTLYDSSNIVSHTFAEGKGVLSVASNVNSVGQWLRATAITNVEIADNFTTIGSFAFRECTNLALTSLPEGITNIGMQVFYGCTSIALTSLPEGVADIGNYAFSGCTNLALASLPEGLTSVGNAAFRGCTNLAFTSLPEGLTSVGDSAFNGCTNLALTSLPEGITNIGMQVFYGCTSIALTSLPEGVANIGNFAFFGCTNIKFLVVNSDIPATIGSNVFNGTTFRIYVPSDKLNDYRSEWSSYASRIYQMSSISYIMTPDGFVHLAEDSIHRKRIVSQIRQTAVADNVHYPSEKCVAMIAEALQSDIDDVVTDFNAKEDKSNKVTTLDNSNTHYPTSKAVKSVIDIFSQDLNELFEALINKENNFNKVTSICVQSTDSQYPSAKAVWTAIKNIQTKVYGIDAAINDVYISPSNRELQLTAGNEGGTIVYYELNQTANEYYLNVINASSMFHGGHSIVLENKTGYSTFITIDDDSFFGIPFVIRQYGNGIDKPAINLSNNQSIKIDYITNCSCVILTASYI